MTDQVEPLQVLIANEKGDRLDTITRLVESLGHAVIGRSLSVDQVGPLSKQLVPDVALVGLGLSDEHALTMISQIVTGAYAPVIALLDTTNTEYVQEAAKRGVFAYVVLDRDPDELRSALDITLRRFTEYHNLEGAFARRALIEQAKGILMARNNIDAQQAYELLRANSQKTGQKLSEIARAITESHTFFPAPPSKSDG